MFMINSTQIKGFGSRRRRRRKPVVLVILLLIAVVIGWFGYSVYTDIQGAPSGGTEVVVTIPSGAGVKTVAALLKENGVIRYSSAFSYYAKRQSVDFQLGQHTVHTAMSYAELCAALSGIGTVEDIKLVVPEGKELREIAQLAEEAGIASAAEFLYVAEHEDFDAPFLDGVEADENRLEGYLFPATYSFPKDVTAKEVIQAMLDKFGQVYTDAYRARAAELGMTDHEIVILASMIEREAASAEEFQRVSGVFHNRLERDMALQSCATIQYILEERKPVLSTEDTRIHSPYNTYLYKGLPIGPIASPGQAAIEAALYPEEHDYYYFVLNSDGSGHIFSRTYQEHQAAQGS